MTSHILASDSILKEGSEAETVCGKKKFSLSVYAGSVQEIANVTCMDIDADACQVGRKYRVNPTPIASNHAGFSESRQIEFLQ